MSNQEVKAHEEKINAQFHEAKALLDQIEAHARKHKAQSDLEKINALKTKKQEIEKKWHQHLKTVGVAAVALKVKSDVEAELAKLKASAEEFASKQNAQAAAS